MSERTRELERKKARETETESKFEILQEGEGAR